MRLSRVILASLFLAGLVGCGDPTPGTLPPSSNASQGAGTNPNGSTGGSSPGGSSTPSHCAGVYRLRNGSQYPVISLDAAGSCQIANNVGVVESTAPCSFQQSGTTLTLISQGVSIDWNIAADCGSLSRGGGTIYYRQ